VVRTRTPIIDTCSNIDADTNQDVLVFFISISLIHTILVSRANTSDKNVYDNCASNSVLMLMWVILLAVFTALISIARSHRPLSILYEILVTLTNGPRTHTRDRLQPHHTAC